MNIRIRGTLALVVTFALLINIPMGCGNSSDHGPSLQDIPRYPYATEGESMAASSPGGLVGGQLAQFTTTDSFDKVVDFYTDALNRYDPEFMSHTSELGRQTAISIPQKNGMISVAIQEFTKEGKVNITLMALGS
ncbi:MAG: hypothetical protein ABUK14_03375 [Desulfobacteria bacterium]